MSYRLFSITLLFTIFSFTAFGQLKIGIKFSPGVTPTRAVSNTDTLTVSNSGSGLRYLAGLVVDYQFRDNYQFRTGVNFLTRKMAYSALGDTPGVTYNDEFVAQHIQIPITLKLNTDEIALDKSIYFQLGTSLDFKVQDDVGSQTDPLVTKMGFFDSSLIIASGLDMKLGTKTQAFGGLVFQRGFLNQARETVRLSEKFTMNSLFIGVEFGIIF